MDFKIRKAVLQDCALIADFNLRMALETENIQLDYQTVLKGVKAVIKDQHKGFYLLAEAEQKVIAQLLITFEWSDWRNKNFWWLQSVYVLPQYRGRGVFSGFFSYLKELACDARNVAGLRLYVDRFNERAQQVYQNCGMVSSHYLLYELEL